MKKTAKTLSIVITAFAMAMCFFFAGLTFIKADTNATEEVGLTVLSGAEVYVPEGDLDDTGMRFIVQIPETGYQALVEKAGLEGEVHLGLEIGSIKDGEFEAKREKKASALEVVNGNMQYTYTLMYNLDRVFGEKYPDLGYMEEPSVEEENEEIKTRVKIPNSNPVEYDEVTKSKKDFYGAQQLELNQMYLTELCIRPWYKTITANGEEEVVYGDAGDVRSILHVAIAEINEYNKGINGNTVLDENSFAYFTSTYLNGEITDADGDFTIDALGGTNITLTECDTYILESSGEIVARKGATSLEMGVHLGKYKQGDVISLYGVNADRTVVKYTATYTGFENLEITPLAKKPVISADGKMYFNDTELDGEDIDGVFYNDLLVSKDGENIDVSTITEEVGSEVEFIIKVGNDLYSGAFIYATKAFEDTAESRKALVTTLKGGASGYYALAEDLHFVGTDGEEQFNASSSSTFSGVFDGRGHTMFDITIVSTPGIFGTNAGICTLKNFAIKGISTLSATNAVFFRYAPAGSEVTVKNVYIYRYVTESKDSNAIFVYGPSSDSYGTWKMSNVIVEQEFASGLSERKNDIFSKDAVTDIAGEFADVYFIANGGNKGAESADGNLKNYRIPEATATSTNATLADSRAQMIEAGNNYDNFSEDYWIIDADGLPAWKNLQTTAE